MAQLDWAAANLLMLFKFGGLPAPAKFSPRSAVKLRPASLELAAGIRLRPSRRAEAGRAVRLTDGPGAIILRRAIRMS